MEENKKSTKKLWERERERDRERERELTFLWGKTMQKMKVRMTNL